MIPKNAKRIPLRPLALGEVTGHSHRVAECDVEKVEMYEMGDRVALRVIDGKVSIIHEEHGPLLLDPRNPTQQRQGDVLVTPNMDIPGWWDVTIQIEETPDEVIRQVAD